jgi:hypothetical protein
MYLHGLQKDKSRIGYTQFAVEKIAYVCGFPVGESRVFFSR